MIIKNAEQFKKAVSDCNEAKVYAIAVTTWLSVSPTELRDKFHDDCDFVSYRVFIEGRRPHKILWIGSAEQPSIGV